MRVQRLLSGPGTGLGSGSQGPGSSLTNSPRDPGLSPRHPGPTSPHGKGSGRRAGLRDPWKALPVGEAPGVGREEGRGLTGPTSGSLPDLWPRMFDLRVLEAAQQGVAPHCSILAWRIPWTEEPGMWWSVGLQTVGRQLSMAWHPSEVSLLGGSHGQTSLEGDSPWGCKEADTTAVT